MKNISTNNQPPRSIRRTAFTIALLVEYLLLIRILFATTLSKNGADFLFSLMLLVFTLTLTAAVLPFFINRQISNKRVSNALLKGVLTVAIFLASFIISVLLLAGTIWVIVILAHN